MASDTFDISAEAISAVNAQLSSMNSQLDGINKSSSQTSLIMSQIPDAIKGSADVFKEMITWMEDIANSTSEAALEARNLAKNMQDTATSTAKVTSEAAKTSNWFKEHEKHLKNIVSGIKNYATSLTGISFTVTGLTKYFIDLLDKSRKLGGMSQIVNAQFVEGGKSIKAMSGYMYNLRNTFAISIEKAGEYTQLLAKAGMEKAQILKYGNQIYAAEMLYGHSIKDQVNMFQNLVNNFNMLDKAAMNYSSLIQQIAKDMPNLSFETVLDDINSINESQKMWNSNLLTSTSLYTVLTNKNISEKLGLDKVPLDLRRNLVKGVAGIGENMSDEWKAAIGMSMDAFKGKSPIQALMGFENLDPVKQLAGGLNFIKQKTGGGSEMTDDRLYKLRQLLLESKMVSSKGEAAQITKRMKEGGEFSSENLEKILTETKNQQKALEDKKEKQGKQRDKNLSTASSAAQSMEGTLKKIERWLESTLLPYVQRIVSILSEFWETLQQLPWFRSAKEESKVKSAQFMIERSEHRRVTEGEAGAPKVIKEVMGEYLNRPELVKQLTEAASSPIAALTGYYGAENVPQHFTGAKGGGNALDVMLSLMQQGSESSTNAAYYKNAIAAIMEMASDKVFTQSELSNTVEILKDTMKFMEDKDKVFRNGRVADNAYRRADNPRSPPTQMSVQGQIKQ